MSVVTLPLHRLVILYLTIVILLVIYFTEDIWNRIISFSLTLPEYSQHFLLYPAYVILLHVFRYS